MRKIYIFLLLILFAVVVKAQIIEPYLSSPTSTSIWVSWKTTSETQSKVEFGLTADNLDLLANGTYTVLGDNYVWHTTKLTGLVPNTRYFYRVVSGNQSSSIHSFRSQQEEGANNGHFRFAIIGDHQVTGDDRYQSLVQACKDKVIEKYATSDSDTLVEDHLNLMVCDGDQVDQGTLSQYEELHFGQSRPLMSNIPIMTVPGNHEYYGDANLTNYFGHYVYDDTSYKNITGNQGEEYYAFQVANVLFVMINSNRTDDGQLDWLEHIVAAADTDESVKWVFAVTHHCFYNEQYPSDGISAVRDGYGTRLAKTKKYAMHITGHAHLYARGSIRNHPCHVVINGGASWDQYWGQTTPVDYQDVQKNYERQIYQIVDIDLEKDEMRVETYSNGTNLAPGFREDVLIDEYYLKLNAIKPNKPFVKNSIPENITLPFTFEGSEYSGQEPFNSVEFQLAKTDGDFSDLEYSYKTDYENLYKSTGTPNYTPIDLNFGKDVTRLSLDSAQVFSGKKYLRLRYRDQSLHWSDWSDTISFNVMNGKPLPPKCPVYRYKLDGNTNELLGGNLNGTPDAGVTFINDADIDPEVASFNNSGMISISSESTENLNLPEKNISVSCWAKFNSFDDWGGLVGLIQDNGNFEKGWLLGTRNDKFSFALSTNGKLNYLTASSAVSQGEWYHVVGTFDGTIQKLFVNGELKASAAIQGDIDYPPTGWFQIGSYKDENEYYGHDGTISDVIIWQRAINLNDAKNLFENTVPPCVDFNSDFVNISEGGEITFESVIQFEPTGLKWHFEAGDPPLSLEQNPVVKYNHSGTFNVTLVATNEYGSDSLSREEYVTVNNNITHLDEVHQNSFKIFPNPTRGVLKISNIHKDLFGAEWSVFSSTGGIIYQGTIPVENNHRIRLKGCLNGIYVFKIRTNKRTYVKKIIVKN